MTGPMLQVAPPPAGKNHSPAATPRPAAGDLHTEAEFETAIGRFVREHERLWLQVEAKEPEPGERFSPAEQARRAIQAEAFLRWAEDRARSAPRRASERAACRDEALLRARRFTGDVLGFTAGSLDFMFSEGYRRVSGCFLREARAFDSRLEAPSLFQALRNVWIAACLQHVFGREVALTPALLGYSLLYPYTDNLLDDPGVPTTIKRAMGRWLSRRLAGERVPPASSSQRRIARLLEMIETEHPREQSPQVHHALRAIHRAQSGSLAQQSAAGPSPAADLLRITAEKGGTSVLADACIVTGQPQAAQAEFAFGYGFLLQLLDDLQDVQADTQAGHWTLFSAQARTGWLDALVSRLLRFSNAWMDDAPCLGTCHGAALKCSLEHSVRWMISQAVALNPARFSAAFAGRMEEFSPLSFTFLREQEHRLRHQQQQNSAKIPPGRALDLAIRFLEEPLEH